MSAKPSLLVRSVHSQPTFAPVALVWVAVLVAVVGLAALLLDVPVARLLAHTPPFWRGIALHLTQLGSSGYMLGGAAAIGLAAVLWRKRSPGADLDGALRLLGERCLYVFSVVALSGLAAQVLKHGLGRARPKLLDEVGAYHFDLLSIKASLASFPSGHTTSAFALAMALGYFLPRWRPLLFVLAVAVGLSRAVVGSHYVSDVLAGALLGIGFALWLARVAGERSIAFERIGSDLRVKGRGSLLLTWQKSRTRACER